MVSDRVAALKRTILFGSLAEAELKALATRAVERVYSRGDTIFMAGEDGHSLFVIMSGAVRAVRFSADGREQVIHVERVGASIGEIPVFDGGTYPSTAIADEDSILLSLDREAVRRLFVEYPAMAMAALAVLSQRLRKCAELVEFLSLREVGQRLARLLVLEAKCSGKKDTKGVVVDLKMTNQQIAAQVGSVREVVSRAFTRLQQDGLIRVEGKRVVIADLEELRIYADM